MENRVLIVGGESLIGKSLISFCKAAHHPFAVTSRRKTHLSDPFALHLELTDTPDRWSIPETVDRAVLCAGMTSLAGCEKNPELSRAVNVEGMMRLIDTLLKRGIKIIYLSSSQVFDGEMPVVTIDHPQSPISVYGSQKAAVEKRLMLEGSAAAILRVTKVLTPGTGLLSEWATLLQKNQSITPFQNMVLSPVLMAQVVMALMKLITGDGSGMFHLSGDEDISYADMGYCLANQIGVSPDRVLPVSADPSLLPKGALPRHTTLDMTRSRLELGIEGREIRHVIHQVIKEDTYKK